MEIVTKNINLFFGKKKILKDINLKISDKSFVGIIGPNGSGKSSLLKCLYRVLKPSSGTIYIDNIILNNLSYKKSALKIAVVEQHNFYNFDMTVLDIVLMGRAPHKKLMENNNEDDYNLSVKSLHKVGLSGYENRSFASLSGGEQQRVILARALTQQTECLILDEPTNHLDIKYQFRIMNILKKLNKTIVMAIHDLNIAAMYCDQIIALKDGKIIECGNPENILTKALIKNLYGIDVNIIKNKEKTNIIYSNKNMECI